MLFVKWLIILATLIMMLGITTLATIYARSHSDNEQLPKHTPWFVAIFGLIPPALYALFILNNLNGFDLQTLSNISLVAIALAAAFLGSILIISKRFSAINQKSL